MTAKKRDRILDYAYRLENRGDIPLNQISTEVIKGLEEPIRYGVVTPRYIRGVLPSRYKKNDSARYTGPTLRLTNADLDREIIIRWKRLSLEEKKDIMEIIREMQKKE